jgi:hypothetical protein
VTPEAPKVLKSQPPTRAPTIPNEDIEHHTLALFVYNFAPYETSEQAQHDPSKKRHFVQLSAIGK